MYKNDKIQQNISSLGKTIIPDIVEMHSFFAFLVFIEKKNSLHDLDQD